jgi:alpha-galactosidase
MTHLVCLLVLGVSFEALAAAPRGSNTWDSWANDVNETHVLASADALAKDFLHYGYDTVTVDGGWNTEMDAYGRPAPDPTRFPSSAGGRGLRPLADAVHQRGLKFGVWVIRGIPVRSMHHYVTMQASPFAHRVANLSNCC